MQIHQHLVGKTGSDLASCLELFCVRVVACQQEGTVRVGSLSLAIVATDNDQITRISYTGEVIFLELLPRCQLTSLLHRMNNAP